MSFTPRLKAPDKGNPYYNTKANNGYNPCIIGNYPMGAESSKRTGLDGLNVLPNCVGYACGRFNEIIDANKNVYTLNYNAKNLYALGQKLGLAVGSTPKVGALIVWSNSGAGHVAVVEQILSDTEILISQSGWSYKGGAMWTAKHQKGTDGNWTEGGDYRWMKGKYTFVGFVYNPAVKEEESEMTQEQFNTFMDNYLNDLASKSTSSWAQNAMDWAKTQGFICGNDAGNLMSRSFLTREQFAVVLKRVLDSLGEQSDDSAVI